MATRGRAFYVDRPVRQMLKLLTGDTVVVAVSTKGEIIVLVQLLCEFDGLMCLVPSM